MLALGERLGDVGSDLARVGQFLTSGGQTFADFGGKKVAPIAGFAGLPAIRTAKVNVPKVKPVAAKKAPAAKTAPAAKPAPAKKAAAKKAPAKKAPAKKAPAKKR